MALFFGLQSLQAYSVFGWFAQLFRDSGYSATTAGLLVGILAGASIPTSLLVPWLAGRLSEDQQAARGRADRLLRPRVRRARDPSAPISPGCGPSCSGSAAPASRWPSRLIGLRSRTREGTAALSGFTQSVGYLISDRSAVRRRG